MRYFDNVKITVLPNGFTVVTDYFKGRPNLSAEIVMATGGFHDPMDQLGLAHFFEHMLSHSHPDMTQTDFSRLIKRKALRANLVTSDDATQAVAEGRVASVMEFMDVAAKMFTHGAFGPEHVEHERGPIVSEMGTRLSHRGMKQNLATLASLFGRNARPTLPTGGYPEHLARITYDQLCNFRHRNVVARNMMFISAGGLSHKDAVKFCRAHFSHLRPGERRPRRGGPVNMSDLMVPQPERQNEDMDMRVRFDASRFIGREGKAEKLDLVELFLSQALHERVRHEEGLLYGADASFTRMDRRAGVLAVAASFHPNNLAPTLECVRDVLNGVSAGEDKYREVFHLAHETVSNIFEEIAIQFDDDMAMRRKRLTESLLETGKLPDVVSERELIATTTFDEATAVVRDIVLAQDPTVEYWGHTAPDLPTGRKIGSMLAFTPGLRAVA